MIKEFLRFREPLLIMAEAAQVWLEQLQRVSKIESKRAAEIWGQAIELPSMRIESGVAIIPIHGAVAQNVGGFEKLFGMVDLRDVATELREAMADESVNAIVFDIDSPGGTYNGTPELAEQIAAANKPTFAFSAGVAASAAYMIASACDNVLASPSATIGQVGTVAIYQSIAKALKAEGVEITVIASDSLKTAGNPLVEMTPEHFEFLKARIMQATEVFRGFVSEHRPAIQEADLHGQYYFGSEAQKTGFIDATAANLAEVVQFAREN
jgi:capsid assembly protease